jgi:hypothetical protein
VISTADWRVRERQHRQGEEQGAQRRAHVERLAGICPLNRSTVVSVSVNTHPTPPKNPVAPACVSRTAPASELTIPPILPAPSVQPTPDERQCVESTARQFFLLKCKRETLTVTSMRRGTPSPIGALKQRDLLDPEPGPVRATFRRCLGGGDQKTATKTSRLVFRASGNLQAPLLHNLSTRSVEISAQLLAPRVH